MTEGIVRLEFDTLILVIGIMIYVMFRVNFLFKHKYRNKKHYSIILCSFISFIVILYLGDIQFAYKFSLMLIIDMVVIIYLYKNMLEEKLLYIAYSIFSVFGINILLISLIMQLCNLQSTIGDFVTDYCRTLQLVLFIVIYILIDIYTFKYWKCGYFFQFASSKKKRVLINVLILTTILASILGMVFFEAFVIGKTRSFFQYPIIMFLIISIFMIFVKLNVDSFEYSSFKENKHTELQAMAKSLELINNIYTDRNIIHHDVKHHFSTIKYLVDSGEYKQVANYVNKLVEKVDLIDNKRICANNVVNGVLILKNDICKKQNIKLNMDIRMREETKIDEYDLVKLFSNAIDNSIEANLKIDDLSKRFININVIEEASFLSLNVRNATDVKGKISLHKTSKKDKYNHGIGIKSIKKVVSKYNGTIEFNNKNYVFSLKAYIVLER